MWKSLLAGTAVLALAGSGYGLAQQRSDSAAPTPPAQTAPTQTAPSGPAAGVSAGVSDSQAFLEARVAALRAGLALSPEQEKAWPAFERAYRAFATMRAEARAARREARSDARRDARSDDPMERLQRFADAASRRAAALKDLADATAPLVGSLDEGQKRRFWALARPLGPRVAGWQGSGRDGWHGRHHGPGHHGWGSHHRGSRDGGGYGSGPRDGYGSGPRGGRDGDGRWGWRDGDRTDGFGGGHHWGPGRGSGGPPWQRDGRRFDDDRRGPGSFGPYGQRERDDDRRRGPPMSDGEERL